MEISAAIAVNNYGTRHWSSNLTLARKLLAALGMAAIVGLAAQVRIYTPFSPVPITGQTLGVLLAGAVMGRGWGGISLSIYVLAGLAGIPWFVPDAGMPIFSAGGIGHLLGPTGGYLIGFILAAFFVGSCFEQAQASRLINRLAIMLFASLVVIYLPGLVWLGVWLNTFGGTHAGVPEVVAMGAVPFVLGDVLKSVIAAFVAARTVAANQVSKY